MNASLNCIGCTRMMNRDLSKDALSIISVRSDLDIIAARMAARMAAQEIGFTKVDQARIATATSELTRNILMHATQGTVTIRHIITPKRRGIEIIFEDKGPGMSEVEQCVPTNAHPSPPGNGGHGLSGSQRLMDTMEINSVRGGGTKVTCQKWIR